MARRKDLTALAALGTLGYMLSKKGDKKDDKQTSAAVERRIAADRDATDQKTSGDKDDMFIEPGSGPHGQQYDDELPGASAPSRASATAPKKPAKPSSAKPSSGTAKAAPKLIDPSNIKSDRREFEESQIAPKLIDPSNIKSDRREFEESQKRAPIDVTKFSLKERFNMKKGGAVKGYASGGTVSSASKRADGIATKGKTRGKIC